MLGGAGEAGVCRQLTESRVRQLRPAVDQPPCQGPVFTSGSVVVSSDVQCQWERKRVDQGREEGKEEGGKRRKRKQTKKRHGKIEFMEFFSQHKIKEIRDFEADN